MATGGDVGDTEVDAVLDTPSDGQRDAMAMMNVSMQQTDQRDAEGYSTNRERMAGGHPQNPNVGRQHGQEMPNNNMGSTACFSGIPPEYEHFDVALLYAKDDYELASDIQDKMNSLELKNKMYPKICLYDDNNFDASQMCKAENVVNLCTLIFVVLTENIHDDMVAHAVREEAFGLTRLAPKDDCTSTKRNWISTKRHCIRPLHTKSEKDRKGVYKTPCGLLTTDSIDWFNFEKKSFKHRLRKLFEFHLPYRLKREQHGCGEKSFQTTQLHGSVSSDKQSSIMQPMQRHLQNSQIVYPPEPSNIIRQESSQTDEQKMSVKDSQIVCSNVSASINRGGKEGRGSGNSSFEADAQPSRSHYVAQTGGSTGPDSGNTHNDIDGACGDALFGDGRSSDSQNAPKQDQMLSDKPSSAIKDSKSLPESSSEQSTAASSSGPLNSPDDANPSETFQPLAEDDLIADQDSSEDDIQKDSTKLEDKPSESFRSLGETHRLTNNEDEESNVLQSGLLSQVRNSSSTDTTAMKDVDKKKNGSAPLAANQNPGMSTAICAVNEGPCNDVAPGETPNNRPDKVPSCEGLNGMEACDHGASNNERRNHRSSVLSGQVAGKNLVTAVSDPVAGTHLQKVASGQIQRNVHGKDDHASDSLTSGQKPSDDIDTVGPRLTPSNGSSHPPIASRTPGDGQSLTEVTFAKPSATMATQTSNSDACKTVPVKTRMTSGSADHDVFDNATKLLEKDSALSEQLKTPLAKQVVEEVNKVLTHELKSDGPAYRTASKCGAPNVVKSSMEVPPTSAAPEIHYHYHAGNQGPGVIDPSVFTPLEQRPQFTPLHVNGPPRYPGPPTQDPQQPGPVSHQAPINIVNCEHVQIGTDGKMIIGDQRERMADSENEDPYESLTSADPSREDSPPPYSVHNPSSPASTSRKTPLTDVSMMPSWTEPRGGNPPCSRQEAVTAGVSQSESESLGNASGLTRHGPRSCVLF